MSGFDLGGLLQLAAIDDRPPELGSAKVPTGSAPTDQAHAGFVLAVNTVAAAHHAEAVAEWAPVRVQGYDAAHAEDASSSPLRLRKSTPGPNTSSISSVPAHRSTSS